MEHSGCLQLIACPVPQPRDSGGHVARVLWCTSLLGPYVSGHVGSLRAAAAGVGTLDVDALVTVGPEGDLSVLGLCPARAGRAVRSAGCAAAARRRCRASRWQRHHAGRPLSRADSVAAAPWRRPVHERQGPPRQRHGPLPAARAITPDSVADAVRALLGKPGYREAAGGLAIEIAAMPAPADPKLEQLLVPVWTTLTACVHAQRISRRSRRR
jgi:hypothetical protein